jgi:phage shock protein A
MRKLNTLFRATVHDSVEQLTDANCVRIYRQEIRDAGELLSRRRYALGAMIANRKDLEAELERAGRKITQRESQVSLLDATTLTDDLLQASAREIAALEVHREAIEQRHLQTREMISREELQLRRLLSELSEHRRDLKLLEAQLGTNGGSRTMAPQETIGGRLIALRETRCAINGGVEELDHLEEGVTEADERVSGSAVERALREVEQDDASLRVAAVMERLKRSTRDDSELDDPCD